MRSRRPFVIALLLTMLTVALWLSRHVLRAPSPSGPSVAAAPGSSAAVAPGGAAASGAAATRAVWRVGGQRSYALSLGQQVTFRKPAGQPGDDGAGALDTFRIDLRGRWNVAIVRSDAFGVLAEVSLTAPQLALGTDRALSAQLAALLPSPFFLQMDERGAVRGLRVPRTHPPLLRALLKSVAASLAYVRGSGSRWTSRELDATGEYEAVYVPTTDGRRCEKSRLRYTQVVSAQGLMPVQTLGRVSGALSVMYDLNDVAVGGDEAARVQKISGQDRVQVDPGPGMPQVDSTATFSLQFVAAADVADAGARAERASGADYELLALGGPDVDAGAGARADQQTLRGARYEDLMAQLAQLATHDDGAARAELLSRMAALVRLDGATAARLQSALPTLPAATQRTLLGALAAAGGGPAQASLVSLAGSTALSADVRSNAVAMLGLVDHPEDSSVAALSQLARDRDPDVRGTAALALGNASLAQRRDGRAGDADQAVDELLAKLAAATTQDEQLLYIQALGNAGDPRALPALQGALAAADGEVRSAAVTALRFIPGETVDALIERALLRDGEAKVRRSAVFAASFRSLWILLSPLRQAVLSDTDDGVRGDIVTTLGRSPATPGVLDVLQAVATRDGSPDVRAAAARAISGRP